MWGQDGDMVKIWADDISVAMYGNSERPRTLLVFLNPFSGSGCAQRVWDREAFPILSKAGALQPPLSHLQVTVDVATCSCQRLLPVHPRCSRVF
jgi:hypothetical protein